MKLGKEFVFQRVCPYGVANITGLFYDYMYYSLFFFLEHTTI